MSFKSGRGNYLQQGLEYRAAQLPLQDNLRRVEEAADEGSHENKLLLKVLWTFNGAFVEPDRNILPQDVDVIKVEKPGLFTGDRIVRLLSAGLIEEYCIGTDQIPPSIAKAPDIPACCNRILKVASGWLDDCVRKHAKCTVTDTSFLPRRVIDVGDHLRSPYLVDLLPAGVSYAALSYCWGSAKDTLVTKRHNLDQHFQSIDLKALPKTIRDAIVVCRCLNIQYLWVDALCIVQDDINEQDWYEQSLQMGNIYSQAHLVISAEAASACIDGFLPNHEPGMDWRSIYVSEMEDGNKLWTAGRPTMEDKRHAGSMRASALSRRGWTMQECILPRRVLHFAEHEIIWECNMSCICQCGKAATHELWKHADYSMIRDPRVPDTEEHTCVHVTDFLHGSSPNALCWVWERLIEQYSHRNLTVADDKLPALSGLTRLFQTELKAAPTEFLAGLWKSSLPAGLLWYVTGSPPSSRPAAWRAPSWSWASIDGGIGYFHERFQFTFQSHINILECHCMPSSIDELGRVAQGWIRLRGIVIPVALTNSRTDTTHSSNQYEGNNGKAPRAHPNLSIFVGRIGRTSYEILPDVRMEFGEAYYCLDVGRTYSRARLGERRSWLLLRKCNNTTGHHGTLVAYERVGIGMFDSISHTVSIFPDKPTADDEVEILLV